MQGIKSLYDILEPLNYPIMLNEDQFTWDLHSYIYEDIFVIFILNNSENWQHSIISEKTFIVFPFLHFAKIEILCMLVGMSKNAEIGWLDQLDKVRPLVLSWENVFSSFWKCPPGLIHFAGALPAALMMLVDETLVLWKMHFLLKFIWEMARLTFP